MSFEWINLTLSPLQMQSVKMKVSESLGIDSWTCAAYLQRIKSAGWIAESRLSSLSLEQKKEHEASSWHILKFWKELSWIARVNVCS